MGEDFRLLWRGPAGGLVGPARALQRPSPPPSRRLGEHTGTHDGDGTSPRAMSAEHAALQGRASTFETDVDRAVDEDAGTLGSAIRLARPARASAALERRRVRGCRRFSSPGGHPPRTIVCARSR